MTAKIIVKCIIWDSFIKQKDNVKNQNMRIARSEYKEYSVPV